MKIRLGGRNQDVAIEKGDEFEFDGTVVKYAGLEFAQPQVRGAYDKNWISEDPESDAPILSVDATRNVAKSNSKTTDLSRVQRQGPSNMSTDAMDEEVILKVGDRSAKENRDARGRLVNHMTASNSRKGMHIQSDGSDEGVVVGRLSTRAKLGKVDVTEHPRLASKLDEISHDKGFGRAKMVEREGVSIKMSVGNVDRAIVSGDEDEGVVVGKVRKSTNVRGTEGISVRDTSNIRAERAKVQEEAQAKPSKSASKPAPKAPAKNGKVSVIKEESLSPRVRIARKIDPDFPTSWEFTGKLSDRIAAVKKHGISKEFIQALYAAEGDQMRKAMEKEKEISKYL